MLASIPCGCRAEGTFSKLHCFYIVSREVGGRFAPFFWGLAPRPPAGEISPCTRLTVRHGGQVEQASCPTKEKFIVVLPVKGSLRHFASLVPLTGGNIELLSNQRAQNVSKAQAT